MTYRFQTNRTVLGDFAEGLVFNYLKTKGSVEYAEDPYDDEKDMIFEGHFNVEVKARSIIFKHPIKNTFAIEENQWRKLDHPKTQTIFVNVPMSEHEKVNLYLLTDRNAYTLSRFAPTKPEHRFYHIDKMHKLYTYNNPNITEKFVELNFSKYKS
jgi:hypothetical protein